MATAVKAASAGMTGAVRSLQWTIQDMNGSVEHLGQSHDHLRRAQNIMAWTTAIFGALLLSGLVWIANDIFHLKDQLMESDRRFDAMDAQMTALGTRMDDVNIAIERLSAEFRAARGLSAPVTGPDVSVLSTPGTPQQFGAAAVAPAAPVESTALDAAAQPQLQPQQLQQPPVQPQQQAALTPAQPAAPAAEEIPPASLTGVVAPSPPAPRDQLTPEELAAPPPVVAAAPAAPAPAQQQAAAAPAAAAPAPAPAAAAPAGDLSDDQLLSFNDEQINPADELLLLDENGNPQ